MKPRERRYINRMIGEAARARGRMAEDTLLTLVRRVGARLSWFVFARKAYANEDAKGIDVVVFTRDVGEILLQSKSSHANAIAFEQEKRKTKIHCVVVSLDDAVTMRRVEEVMERAHAERKNSRVAQGG